MSKHGGGRTDDDDDNSRNNNNNNNNNLLLPHRPREEGGGRGGETTAAVEEMDESSFQSGTSPFFADAILDLDTAHDLAETPDATQLQRRTIAPLVVTAASSAPSSSSTAVDAPRLPSTATTTTSSSSTNADAMISPLARRRLEPKTTGNVDPDDLVKSTTGNDAPPAATATASGIFASSTRSHNGTGNREMTRITHMDGADGGTPAGNLHRMRLLWRSMPRSRPTWPRDWTWALAFCAVVPLSFLGPLCLAEPEQSIWTQPPLSTATFGAWIVSALAAVVTTRWMYGKRHRDEDRNTRHERIATGLLNFAAWSVVVYVVLAVTIFVRLPSARWTTVLPLAYTVRDVYLVRRWKQRRGGVSTLMTISSTTAASQASPPSSSSSSSSQASAPTTGQSSSSSSYASRYAFFQALTAMALDILAQSLRRASFFRVLTFILLAQTLVIGLWRHALIGALDDKSVWLLLLAALGGKWATGTLARLLSLVASGGVVNWFVQQQDQYPNDNNRDDDDDVYGDIELSAASDSQVPEAYRTVGASVYQSVLRMDDVLDDDDDDDDDFEQEEFRQENQEDWNGSRIRTGGHVPPESLTTVRGLVADGLSVSFGSVVMCGLLGGPAQFVWSQIRKVQIWQQHGHEPTNSVLERVWNQVLLWARSFVRNHSDLAMTHVAAYYKPYPRASRDVARLIEEAGVEPVLHDDISTHICSCVGGTISGVIVLFTGHFAQRELVLNGNDYEATDLDVVKNMLLAFILSYTLIFTVMEPLRAAIKAVYVAYAQNPRSLSHAYPLIYHRLTRLSEANLS